MYFSGYIPTFWRNTGIQPKDCTVQQTRKPLSKFTITYTEKNLFEEGKRVLTVIRPKYLSPSSYTTP
jgi:hypothetical protein